MDPTPHLGKAAHSGGRQLLGGAGGNLNISTNAVFMCGFWA